MNNPRKALVIMLVALVVCPALLTLIDVSILTTLTTTAGVAVLLAAYFNLRGDIENLRHNSNGSWKPAEDLPPLIEAAPEESTLTVDGQSLKVRLVSVEAGETVGDATQRLKDNHLLPADVEVVKRWFKKHQPESANANGIVVAAGADVVRTGFRGVYKQKPAFSRLGSPEAVTGRITIDDPLKENMVYLLGVSPAD